ncbi:MAG TPA: hypothetical protein EYO33_27290 [Phycisphaerales bacterium]|nr:hypothetical protein [Phycisphaerales bacterium]
MGFLSKVGELLRGLTKRRRGEQRLWLGRLKPLETVRVCSLFDFFEFTPAQKAAVVFASLDGLQRKKLLQTIQPKAMHQVVRENMARRSLNEELEDSILKDFLGLELTGGGPTCLTSTRQCLKQLVESQIDMVAFDLEEMLLNDREALTVENFDAQHFYSDLSPYHKAALLLWLTNSLHCSQTTGGFSAKMLEHLEKEMGVVSLLRLKTKLRVLREFLGIDLNKRPSPNAAEEFGRLAVALTKVKEEDPRAFGRVLLQQWLQQAR